MPLWYMGPTPTDPDSLADVSYVNSLVSQSLSPAAVKSEIVNRTSLVTYARNSDASSVINSTVTDQQFARQSDLTSLTSTKINLLTPNWTVSPPTGISRANGPIALNPTTGKIDPSLINGLASSQRYPQMYWTPSSYTQLSGVTNSEQTIDTILVTSTYSTYKVFVTGTINAKTTVDGQYPIINVRAGSATGQIVATGYGVAENYKGGALTVLSTSSISLLGGYTQTSVLSSPAYNYSIPSWCNKIDVTLIGGGGGGLDGIAISNGLGGNPGSWSSTTLTRGGNLSSGALALTGNIGLGASPGTSGSGGSTTCVVPGGSTLSVGGGGSGAHTSGFNNYQGVGPGNTTYGGITYLGGTTVTAYGTAGNTPGGGGSGGKAALGGSAGGYGADGAAFFYAYINDDNNYSQITVLPAPMSTQASLTAPTTLYVNVLCSGTGQLSTDSFNPQISVMVVPS